MAIVEGDTFLPVVLSHPNIPQSALLALMPALHVPHGLLAVACSDGTLVAVSSLYSPLVRARVELMQEE